MIKKKRAAVFVLMAALLLLVTGCKKTEVEETLPGDPVTIDDVTQGTYIMTQDGLFYYANTKGQLFNNDSSESDASRVIYSKDDSKYIPCLYGDDSLVYFSEDEIPESIRVEKFYDSGYSCGLYGISLSSDGNFRFSGSNFISDSAISNAFNGYVSTSDKAIILSINGKTPALADFTEAGTIKCSNKDEEIVIDFTKGTYYKEVKTTADEHLWYSQEVSYITDYEMTKNGFIILSLPDNIEDGDYISVDGTGLMKVSRNNRPQEE